MKQAYIVTEGKTDVEILKKLLPRKVVKFCEFVPGSGGYSARSLAGTLLAVKQLPVALVLDTDTVDESIVREKVDFAREWLRQASGGVRFEVFPAVPEIEVVFFQDRCFVESLVDRTLTDTEWKLAKFHPKEALTNVLGNHASLQKNLLGKLTDKSIHALQQHSLIVNISEFLSKYSQSKKSTENRIASREIA